MLLKSFTMRTSNKLIKIGFLKLKIMIHIKNVRTRPLQPLKIVLSHEDNTFVIGSVYSVPY